MNLLTSSYTGKVGATYGVKQRKTHFVKAVPFSHSPHNEKQEAAVAAFTLLNRLSAVIAKKMWKYLGLSDRQMYRSNAVAQWLKSTLVNNSFILSEMAQVIPMDGSLSLDAIEFSSQDYSFSAKLTNVLDTPDVSKEMVFLAVITNACVSKFADVRTGQNIFASSVFEYIDFAYFQVVAFKAIPYYYKYKIKGLVLSAPVYVIIVNRVFYVLRWSWTTTPYVLDRCLYLPAGTEFVGNRTLFLR